MNIFSYIQAAVWTLPMKGRRNILKIMTLGVGLAVGLVLASKVCFEKTFDDF
jgi:putative ABC transport system permease protein